MAENKSLDGNGVKHLWKKMRDYVGETCGDMDVTVDSALNETSENPVQNKVVAKEINSLKCKSVEYFDPDYTDSYTLEYFLNSGHLNNYYNINAVNEGTIETYEGIYRDTQFVQQQYRLIVTTNNSGSFTELYMHQHLIIKDKQFDRSGYASSSDDGATFTATWENWVEFGSQNNNASIEVDSALSTASENPVQNKVVTESINEVRASVTSLTDATTSTVKCHVGDAIPTGESVEFKSIHSGSESTTSIFDDNFVTTTEGHVGDIANDMTNAPVGFDHFDITGQTIAKITSTTLGIECTSYDENIYVMFEVVVAGEIPAIKDALEVVVAGEIPAIKDALSELETEIDTNLPTIENKLDNVIADTTEIKEVCGFTYDTYTANIHVGEKVPTGRSVKLLHVQGSNGEVDTSTGFSSTGIATENETFVPIGTDMVKFDNWGVIKDVTGEMVTKITSTVYDFECTSYDENIYAVFEVTVVTTEINDVKTALDSKAPTSHTSSSTMYGVGTSTEYGHLKVADNLTTTTSGTALSANQGKVLSDKISNVPIKYMEKGSTASTNMSTNATVGTDAVIVGDLRSRSYGTVISGAVATGDYSLALGTGATAIGSRSTSIGYSSTTSGAMSQSLGYNAYTSSQYALALGYNAKANGRSSIAMLAGTASGEQAFALGQNALASGDYSLAISLRDGYQAGTDMPKRETSAEAAGAISIGRSNKVSCENALAIGGTYNTVSVGGNSAIVGGYLNTIENGGTGVIAGGACNTIISGGNMYGNAIIAGFYCSVSKDHSFAQGSHNDALRSQFKIGHYSEDGREGGYQGTTGDAFIIGNGTNTQDEEGNYTARSNAFRVSYSGGVYGGAAYNSSGADYAEYFEWIDGNPDGEDRRGLFVTLDGEKIRLATDEDDYILGVVSSTPCVQGDNYSDDWQRKYLTDVFGARLTQTVHHEAVYEERETIDTETGKKTVKKVLVQEAYDSEEWILNPDYDPTQEYVSREDRKEWSPIGFMGKLVVIDDGTCKVNGYCKAGENGIATKTTDKSGYRVMERIDDTHIKILVR